MSENEKEENKPSDTGRYAAERIREVVPPSAKQVRNRLLLYIVVVVLLCVAASQDLGALFGL
jgi:hypothetical protein